MGRAKFTFLALILGVWILSSLAVNFQVTSTNCTGPGSITEAIKLANANPGTDDISFDADLVINIDSNSCGLPLASGFELDKNYIGFVNESVNFIGNNAFLSGCQQWVNNRGQTNPVGSGICPRDDNLLVDCTSPGFISVGIPGRDNSNIRVTMKDMRIKHLEQIVNLEDGASLDIDKCSFESIYAQLTCNFSPIYGDKNNIINITRSSFKDCWIWTRGRESLYGSAGTILSNGPRLYVFNTTFNLCKTQMSISFMGQTSSDVANIVSCRFQGLSEGLQIFGKGTMNIYNSLLNFGYPYYEGSQFYRIFAVSTTVNLVASTVVVYSAAVAKGT